MDPIAPTPRTSVRRLPARGVYDRATVYSILDEGMFCHVAFNDGDSPVVIPTLYGRKDDRLFLHGSPASRMIRQLGAGIPVSVAVTLVDGLVFARSAFHHSMNYRSVVIFGQASIVSDAAEKFEALRVVTEHIAPGRWGRARVPSEKELKATSVLSLPLDEVSAKVRTGPPVDDQEDLSNPVWAGVIPLSMKMGAPLPDAFTAEGAEVGPLPSRFSA